jgi:hypothetical protein
MHRFLLRSGTFTPDLPSVDTPTTWRRSGQLPLSMAREDRDSNRSLPQEQSSQETRGPSTRALFQKFHPVPRASLDVCRIILDYFYDSQLASLNTLNIESSILPSMLLNNSMLLSLVLVCKSWNVRLPDSTRLAKLMLSQIITLPLLYRCVCIKTQPGIHQLRRAISRERSDQLPVGTYIRTIHIMTEFIGEPLPFAKDLEEIARCSPKLNAIFINEDKIPMILVEDIALAVRASSSLTSLYLPIGFRADFESLSEFTSLKTLSLVLYNFLDQDREDQPKRGLHLPQLETLSIREKRDGIGLAGNPEGFWEIMALSKLPSLSHMKIDIVWMRNIASNVNCRQRIETFFAAHSDISWLEHAVHNVASVDVLTTAIIPAVAINCRNLYDLLGHITLFPVTCTHLIIPQLDIMPQSQSSMISFKHRRVQFTQ